MENVSGLDLVPKLIRKYITELMEPGKAYSTPDITHLVHDHHQSKDGIPSDVRDPDKQVRAELTKLKKGGVVQSTVDSKWILVAEADEALPEERVLKSEDEADAEVSIGEGPELVYGWYYPTYRRCAELEGKDRYQIKVGRTQRVPLGRMDESKGTVPERPVLGFVLKIDDCKAWEQLFHAKLTIMGRQIDDAIGQEWFWSTVEELGEIAKAEMADIDRWQLEASK